MEQGEARVQLSSSVLGGWLKLRDIPQHLWSEDLFRKIGDCFGGYIDFAYENAALIDCMEVAIRVKGNYCGFLPAGVTIRENEKVFTAHTVTFQDSKFLVGKEAAVHGGFSPEAAKNFYGRLLGTPGPYPIDRWRVENGFYYPVVQATPSVIPTATSSSLPLITTREQCRLPFFEEQLGPIAAHGPRNESLEGGSRDTAEANEGILKTAFSKTAIPDRTSFQRKVVFKKGQKWSPKFKKGIVFSTEEDQQKRKKQMREEEIARNEKGKGKQIEVSSESSWSSEEILVS